VAPEPAHSGKPLKTRQGKIAMAGKGYNVTDPDNVIHARVNEEITIVIESNPSTGYNWQPHFNEGALELMDSDFVPESLAMGSGGVEVFRFLPKKAGKEKIKMSYKRQWEQKPVKEMVYSIRIS
jgi:predicted secreted protein